MRDSSGIKLLQLAAKMKWIKSENCVTKAAIRARVV